MERRETTLLSNAAFLAASYVDSRYQKRLKYFQKTFGSIEEELANDARLK